MAESSYEREPGVAPVKVRTLRAVRQRAKRGQFDVLEESAWLDCFTDRTDAAAPRS